MRTYTTIQGDMWDGIAFTQLGSTAHVDDLMKLNPKYIGYYTFPAGIVLMLPEPVVEADSSMPPWKKVSK